MQTNTCCICDTATLLHRQNLSTLAVMAGVCDALLRQFAAEQQSSKPGAHETWAQLGDQSFKVDAVQTLTKTAPQLICFNDLDKSAKAKPVWKQRNPTIIILIHSPQKPLLIS
tara:strand:+ start:1364 stop:1702 length:339 start_codon:yes stop_codon:yes gene_type:complete